MKTLETLKFIGQIRSNKNRQRGFTLIELIIVLAIIGVLAAIGIPRLTNLQTDAELKGVASTLASEAGNQFAEDLLTDADTAETEWAPASVCDDLIGTDGNGPLIDDTSIDSTEYPVGPENSGTNFSVPSFAGDGDVTNTTCAVSEAS